MKRDGSAPPRGAKQKIKNRANLQGSTEQKALGRVFVSQVEAWQRQGAITDTQRQSEANPGKFDGVLPIIGQKSLDAIRARLEKHDIAPHEHESLPIEQSPLEPAPIVESDEVIVSPEYAEINRAQALARLEIDDMTEESAEFNPHAPVTQVLTAQPRRLRPHEFIMQVCEQRIELEKSVKSPGQTRRELYPHEFA